MLKLDLNLKKASVRTMLPVASAGFSCLWGMLLVVLAGTLGGTARAAKSWRFCGWGSSSARSP